MTPVPGPPGDKAVGIKFTLKHKVKYHSLRSPPVKTSRTYGVGNFLLCLGLPLTRYWCRSWFGRRGSRWHATCSLASVPRRPFETFNFSRREHHFKTF